MLRPRQRVVRVDLLPHEAEARNVSLDCPYLKRYTRVGGPIASTHPKVRQCRHSMQFVAAAS